MNENGTIDHVEIKTGKLILTGTLTTPPDAGAIIIFAHGSGSSRFSSRNRHVAAMLNEAGFATLLFDLLTAEEEKLDTETAQLRFDIDFLAQRLVTATAWVIQHDATRLMPIGYFGASTGAAAALTAAVEFPRAVGAVVSRGGRPDLAARALAHVVAPTLLIVGGADTPVVEMNRSALGLLRCQKHMEIVPNATHLFEEPGALDTVARLAIDWFQRHLLWRAGERASSAS